MSSLPILELRWKVVFARLPRGTLMGILFTGIVPEPFQGVYENIGGKSSRFRDNDVWKELDNGEACGVN